MQVQNLSNKPSLDILAKRLAIMAMVGSVGISKSYAGVGYKCRTITQALAELNQACVTNGVVFSQSEVAPMKVTPTETVIGEGKTAKVERWFLVQATYQFSLTSVSDSSQTSERVSVAISCKDLDKATGKLMSYALKTWFFNNGVIPDAGIDDPDYDQAVARAFNLSQQTSEKKKPGNPKKVSPAEKPVPLATVPEASPEPSSEEPSSEEPSPEPSPEPPPKTKAQIKTERCEYLDWALDGNLRAKAGPIKERLASLGFESISDIPEDQWEFVVLDLVQV
jgi:hypothetical protein